MRIRSRRSSTTRLVDNIGGSSRGIVARWRGSRCRANRGESHVALAWVVVLVAAIPARLRPGHQPAETRSRSIWSVYRRRSRTAIELTGMVRSGAQPRDHLLWTCGVRRTWAFVGRAEDAGRHESPCRTLTPRHSMACMPLEYRQWNRRDAIRNRGAEGPAQRPQDMGLPRFEGPERWSV